MLDLWAHPCVLEYSYRNGIAEPGHRYLQYEVRFIKLDDS